MKSTPFTSRYIMLAIALSLQATLVSQECIHQDILDKLDKALMEKDPLILAEVYHPNAVRYLADAVEKGLSKIQEGAKQFYESIPDAKGTNNEVICTENKMIVRWSGTGTPINSSKPVRVTGITIYEIVDGKIAMEWEEMSRLSLMVQMGYELKAPGGN